MRLVVRKRVFAKVASLMGYIPSFFQHKKSPKNNKYRIINIINIIKNYTKLTRAM